MPSWSRLSDSSALRKLLNPRQTGTAGHPINFCSYRTIPVLNLSPLCFSTAFTLAGLQAGPSPNHRKDVILQGKGNLVT